MARIGIVYCKPCGYAARAERLARLLESKGWNAELRAGKGGIFEICVNGKAVARKTRAGFPADEDVVAAIAAAVR